ncbi:MAG: hypothetical protein RhofKO_05580 [Rhodothermales bacterium]
MPSKKQRRDARKAKRNEAVKVEEASPRRVRSARRAAAGRMVFERRNYLLLLLGVALITFGYVIMRLDNQVESLVSLYIAPLIILGGYLEIIYAILWRPKPAADAVNAAA